MNSYLYSHESGHHPLEEAHRSGARFFADALCELLCEEPHEAWSISGMSWWGVVGHELGDFFGGYEADGFKDLGEGVGVDVDEILVEGCVGESVHAGDPVFEELPKQGVSDDEDDSRAVALDRSGSDEFGEASFGLGFIKG